MSELQVNVADLLLPTGARRQVAVTALVDGLRSGASAVEAPLEVDVMLERVSSGVMVSGEVRGSWAATCSRCLTPLDRGFRAPVRELYARAHGDELAYPLEGGLVDLELAVRDTVVLRLPLAPLCDPGCRGLCPTCGIDRNEAACGCPERATDIRWAALANLGTTGGAPDRVPTTDDDDERGRTRGQRSN